MSGANPVKQIHKIDFCWICKEDTSHTFDNECSNQHWACLLCCAMTDARVNGYCIECGSRVSGNDEKCEDCTTGGN